MNYKTQQAVDLAINTTASIGRAGLNALYPNDFELYMMSFELVDVTYDGKEYTESLNNFFSFPVLPNSYSQSEPQITNIKKNFNSITILNNNSFVPKDITLSGNFGKHFSLIVGLDLLSLNSYNFQNPLKVVGQVSKKKIGNQLITTKNSPIPSIKTGYGCIKVLQSICDNSVDTNNGIPKRLYFHNPAFGESYLVKITNFTTSQSTSNNTIWNYSIQMKAVMPSELVYSPSKNTLLKIGEISSAAGSGQTVKKLVKSIGGMLS